MPSRSCTAALAATTHLALGCVLRPWCSRWGATDEEVRRTLPGDEFVPTPRAQSTWALTVAAPPERVWPWLVPLPPGHGRRYDLAGNWQFVLEASGENATRLILRARSGPSPTPRLDIVAEPGYFLMMLGIKRRAEASF